MAKLKIALLGATGKMGQMLQELLVQDAELAKNFSLVAKGSRGKKLSAKELKSSGARVLIDFSLPTASLAAAKECSEAGVGHLICVTGFTESELKALHKIHHKSLWARVANTSLGIFALGEALKVAAKLLPKTFDISLVEIHHGLKKDAPSGTAKYLAEILRATTGRVSLPVLSIRGGTEAGEHRVIFLGKSERLEFLHRAESRALFARGALTLAAKLAPLKARVRAYELGELV